MSSPILHTQRVIDEALEVEEKFISVLNHTKMEFSRKPAEFLNELRTTIVTLRVSSRFKHLQFLTSERERILNASSVDEVFMILDDYWDYTNYALLQYLVQTFGENTLKREMSEYVAALEHFEKKTTIQESESAGSNNRRRKRSLHDGYEFSTVDIQLRKDPKVCTLYEARQEEESVAKRACLEPYVMRQRKVSCHSVVIGLVCSRSALELIFVALDEEFLETHQISSVTIDNKPLKEYSKEYVKVCAVVRSSWYVH